MASETQSTQPRWILSFADLLSVILSFLVLAYSMALPTNTKPVVFHKDDSSAISALSSSYKEKVDITRNDQVLSANYLYQIMSKKIAEDPELAPKLTLKSEGDSLIITIQTHDYMDAAAKLVQLLKVAKNDIWIYSSNLDISRQAYEELKKRGFDNNVTIMDSEMPNTQIDIVIHP